MSSTEARTTDGGTAGTTESRDDAGSAAERLGGPIEDEQSRDTARRAETEVDRQADTAVSEGERSAETARRSETDADRQADTTVSEGERSAARRSETDADRQTDTSGGQRATLIETERAESYNSRWNALKSEFVDDPRGAVQGANRLVGEVLDELEQLFRRQRADLEHGLDSEQTSTEDLRQALGRYRSFFDRLLSF
ncbi:MAG TPA: hypothetical protein VI094_18055 [Propionibacteriaceae bacterium]